MIKVEALTNFTKQALLDRKKAIQALNGEQIQMRKAVIHNRMALVILTAAQGGTCAIIKVECCVYIPDLSGNLSTALDDPGGSEVRASAWNAGDLGSIPGLGRSPGGGHGNPLQYSCLENPHGQRSLMGYSPRGHKESDTAEAT